MECYICNTPSDFYSHLSKTFSTHSNTPISEFIDKIMGAASNENNVDWNDCIVCIECFGKIDEYDWAWQTVQRVENELREMLLRPKVEPVDIAYIDDGVNITESVEDENDTINLDRPYQLTELEIDQIDMNYDDDDEDQLPLDEDDIDVEVIAKPENKFTCDDCKAVFCSSREYRQHKRTNCVNSLTSQQEQKGYGCRICSEIFNARNAYESHMRDHKLEDNKYKCKMCCLDLKEQTALDEHIKLHTESSPLQCVLCPKIFKKKGALVRHTRIHSDSTFYQCDRCGKEFVHRSSFKMHIMAHDDIRKLKCSECGQMFRSSSHLTRHLRVHSGAKPYSCPVCGQKFAQRYNMSVHKRLHDKPAEVKETAKTHICKFCNTEFDRQSKLIRHLQTKHRVI